MKKIVTWLAWTSIALVAALAALNGPALLAPAPISFGFTEVQWPLGLLMLGLLAVPLALFFVAYLHHQIGKLMETRGLLKELQHAHVLADKAEASRVEGLRQLMIDEFSAINERLDSLGVAPPLDRGPPSNPTGLRRILAGPWKADLRQL